MTVLRTVNGKMEKVRINTEKGYDVLIGAGLLELSGELSAHVLRGKKAAIFADERVYALYGNIIEKSFADAGFEIFAFKFEGGESSKNIDTVARFVDFMAERHFSRKDAVVALGGGVAGDMGGFAASIYQRGIDFIQIPTTFLAAVDSSVGGKTGVNISAGKNLMGAFWQPSLVIYDTDTALTLGRDLLLDGMAEVIKTGAIRDKELYDFSADSEIIDKYSKGFGGAERLGGADEDLLKIVKRCVEIKGAVVEADEKESGLRKILNFGHTMAHAIEKHSNYRISHGKAVAMGMMIITAASEACGLTKKGTAARMKEILEKKGYSTNYGDAGFEELSLIAASDKKASGGNISIVYITEPGHAETRDVDLAGLADFLKKGAEINYGY